MASTVLTVQSVSDARVRRVRRQGSPDPALEAVFSPRAVAIVGASDDSAKWGHIIARRALSSRGLARVNDRFAWPVIARQHLAFFERCRA